jgi:hypothetical protein
MDVDKYKSTMNSLNYGNVMAKAAEDYQKVRANPGCGSFCFLHLSRFM